MLISLADVKTRIAALHTGISHIQLDVKKVYNYLNAVASRAVTPILIPPSDLTQILTDIKEEMTAYLNLSL